MCPLRVLLIGASALVALAWLLHSYWAVEDVGEKQQQTSDKPKKVRFVPWEFSSTDHFVICIMDAMLPRTSVYVLSETERQRLHLRSSGLNGFSLLPEHLEDSGRHGDRCVFVGQLLQNEAVSDCTAGYSDAL